MFSLKLVLFIFVFTFENMRILKMAKTNIERAKKLKVYFYNIDVRDNLCHDINAHSIKNSLKKALSNHWDEEDWINNMRISNDAFNLLCNTLRPHISKEDTKFLKCIPPEIKLAVTLYYLSGAIDYGTIANLFGLGRSIVYSIVHTVHKQIVKNLLKTYINLPKREETRKII